MNNKIEIYTKPYCSHCHRAKELLRIKGVEFVEYDISANLLRVAEVRRLGELKTLPGIFINDDLVSGCKELFDLEESGALDSMLGLAVPSGHLNR